MPDIKKKNKELTDSGTGDAQAAANAAAEASSSSNNSGNGGGINALFDAVKSVASNIGNAVSNFFSGNSSSTEKPTVSGGSSIATNTSTGKNYSSDSSVSVDTSSSRSSGSSYSGTTNPFASSSGIGGIHSFIPSDNTTPVTRSGRTYSGTGTKAQNPEKAQKKAAAQTAAEIAQQRGQSRTNKLKTYYTEENNWQTPKYKTSEELNGTSSRPSMARDSFSRALENQQIPDNNIFRQDVAAMANEPKEYLSGKEYDQMDRNDSYSLTRPQRDYSVNNEGSLDPADWQIEQAKGAQNSTADYLTGAERGKPDAGLDFYENAKNFIGDAKNAANSLYDSLKANAYDKAAPDAATMGARELDHELKLNFDTIAAYVEDPEGWGKAYNDAIAQIIDTAKKTYGEDSGVAEQILSQIESQQRAISQILSDKSLSSEEQQQRIDQIRDNFIDVGAITLPNQYPMNAEADALRAHAREISPALIKEPQQLTPELEQTKQQLLQIANATDNKQLADLIKKYTSNQYADNFFGQFAASFGSGEVSELSNQAMYAWLNAVETGDPKADEYRDIAAAYDLLSQYYQQANIGTLDDEGRQAGLITKDFAQYLPQFREQSKSRALPVIAGAGIGFVAGEVLTPIPGIDGLIGAIAGATGKLGGVIAGGKIGNIVGSVPYSYQTMRGAAAKGLLDQGASMDDALAMSRDEAIISTAVESLDTAIDTISLIPGIGEAFEKLTINALKKGIGAYVANIASEYGEEFVQEAISIANERRLSSEKNGPDSGVGGLFNELKNLIGEVAQGVQSGDEDAMAALDRAREAGRGGAGVAITMGPTGAVINNVLTGPIRQAGLNAINSLDRNQSRAALNQAMLDGRISQETANAARKASPELQQQLTQNRTPMDYIASAATYNMYSDQFEGKVVGDVILDENANPVATIQEFVPNVGFTVKYNDGTTESVTTAGNRGLLDPKSKLAKILDDGGSVETKEDADIIIRNAEQERKAQIKAGEEMQDRGEKAQPQAAPQPPKADTPAPHKAPTPAKAQPAQQQTTQQQAPQQEAPQQEQQAPQTPQFQNQDVYDNVKYEVEELNGKYYVKTPEGLVPTPWNSYEEAMGFIEQLSQQNPTPRNTTGEQRAEEQAPQAPKAETPVQTQEESQPEATQEQEAPSEPEAPPSRSPLADSVTEANTVTENNGTPSKAEQYFADNPKKTTYQTTYKEAGVKIKKNADGTFTVSMASPKKNGNGWTKGVSVIGTVNSISEANQLVVDEYSKKSAPKALADSATGTPIESPQNASESVSQEEGNSVLPNEQNASETQNEKLNSKPEPETKLKRSMTLFENESEGQENTRQVGNISYVTETDAASIDNIRASKQNYELGGERFSAEDVDRMTAEDVLYRLKAWAKKLNFGGIKGFANKIGAVITSIQDTSGANYQIEKSFYDVISRTDSGNAKNKSIKKDYSNRNNVDRAAYEASQSMEGLQRNRADSAFMYLLEQDANAKLSDALSAIVKEEPAHLQASAEHILNGIFKKAGLDMDTATVQDGIAALAESGNVDVAEVLGMSEEDIEEIFALLDRANQIEVVLNGKNLTLNEILDGTVELEESDDSTFAEKDFHGESTRKEAIDAIDEDIEGLRNAIDVLESSTGHENAIRELEKQIDALEQQKEAYLEEEQQDEREADKNYRDVSNETDILTATEEEEADNAAVSRERGRRPELGSISRNNQPFIKKADVPAEHLKGSAGRVRGIKYNGETYYAVSSLEKGGYRNIIPDGDVAKAKRVIQAFEDAIEQQQRTVDYYLTMMRNGDMLTSTQENSLKKAQQGVFDLQRKLDIINGGTYTLQDLWNDNRVPADIKSMSPSNEDIRNRSLAAIANAVTESDAIRGIKAMEGESYGRQSALQSRTQNTQRNDTTRKERTGAKTNERGTALRKTQEWRDDLGKRRQDSKAVGGRKTGDHLISKKTETDAITAIRGSKTPDMCGKLFSALGYKVRKINNNLSRSFVKEKVVAKNGRLYTPIGETAETARLRNKISNMNRFHINQVESVIDFTYDKNGKLVGIVSYGLCKEENGSRQIWGDKLTTWNHESSHDDFNLADIAVSERQANGETINDVEEIVGEALTRALDAVGLDYADFEADLLAREYEPDEINGELYAEFTAMMHEGTTSEWDANTTIPGLSYSEAGKKLAGNKEFQNLVKAIQSYADEGYFLYESNLSNSAQSTTGNPKRATFDQYSDESFDALVNDTSYEEASAINGQNYDQYDLNSELGAEQASETETLNNMSGRGVDTTAAPIENFQNAEQASENAAMEDLSGTGVDTERTPIDYFQSQEQASESDLIREQSRNDLTGSEDTNFESPYEAEQRTEQEAMDSLYENMDGRKLTSPKRTANDYYGSAYARVQETQKKHKRNKARSSFSIAELYYKTYGETNDSIRNFKRLQRLNSNVDSLLDGKMSYYDFNSFAKNMSSRQGIGQILNDDIQSELDRVVALEEAAQDKNASEQDVADFQYAAANVVSHIVARMDMVEKTERARARLDTAAKKHGAKGGRKNLIGSALDAWNRYQITGDNFWRMMDDWAGKGQGYSYAKEHLKTIATRISEEAKLKGYFEGIDKNSKEFKDFASGTTMSNVDFNGHKISLMEGIKFVKTVDTLRMFASENGRPSWQRVAALGGFTFEGKNGKPIFVDIQGSYDNNAEARAKWVEAKYNQLKQEIANNKAASAYMSAVEEMYYEASKDAEKVHSKVNGYDRYMYGKGWYTDIHYANKNSGTVDFRYADRDATDVHDTASMQRRTKVAGGYAIINPMSRSVDAYISQISNYIAFEEFGQKLGVLSDSKSINGSYANTIRDAYGDQYAQWFDNYVKSMTLFKDHKPQGTINAALAKSRQLMMSGALVASISVPMKQVSSFFDTMGTLDPRAVRRAFYTNPLGLKQKGIKNYLMDSRNQSVSSPEFAELFGETGLLGKVKNNWAVKLARNATSRMDATTVSNVYKAAMYDVEYNNPLGKGIYNNGKNWKDGLTPDGQFYVDAKFEEALLGSQPIFTPQARNELARTDDQFKRMFQTFRTQQTQNYNRALQAINEYQAAKRNGTDTKEKAKTLRDTVQGQLAASVSLAALTAIANAVMHKHHKYKDDDDEFSWEKFAKRFGLDTLESFAGNGLFIGDLTKWVIDKANISDSTEFYGISAGALSTAFTIGTSAMALYGNLQEEGWTQANKVAARYLAGNIATATGMHANNIYNFVNAGYQWFMDIAQAVTGDKRFEKKYDDIFLQWAYVDDQPQNRLVNAILENDTDKITDMYNDMGQDKFQNAVYYGAFDKFKAGKIDKAEYVELLMNFAGKSYKDAHNEVEKKSKLLESGISQYNGIDGRDGRKAFYERYSDNFKSRAEYKQFFADVKEGKADGKHNTYYTTYNGKQQEVSANQSSIIDTMNRNIQAGNFTYDTAKLLWENYYGYSTSRYSAWKFVGK